MNIVLLICAQICLFAVLGCDTHVWIFWMLIIGFLNSQKKPILEQTQLEYLAIFELTPLAKALCQGAWLRGVGAQRYAGLVLLTVGLRRLIGRTGPKFLMATSVGLALCGERRGLGFFGFDITYYLAFQLLVKESLRQVASLSCS